MPRILPAFSSTRALVPELFRRRVALLFAATVAAVLALSGTALAGAYRVEVCTPTANDGELFQANGPAGAQGYEIRRECGMPFGGIRLIADSATVSGGVLWELDVPGSIAIRELEADRSLGPLPWDALFHWRLTGLDHNQTLDSAEGTAPPPGHVDYSVGDRRVRSEIACIRSIAQGGCGFRDGFTVAEVDFSGVVATLEENVPPTVALTSTPPPTTPLRGTVQVPYAAEDRESGVASGLLLRDIAPGVAGVPVAEDRDPNGGRCVEPFKTAAPCAHKVESSFSLDTTKIPDGPHTITAVVGDAAANTATGETFQILVHNAPANVQRPALAGAPATGQTLSTSDGVWDGAPSGFAYRWLRCPATVKTGEDAPCTPIAGATSARYAVAAADVGRRLVARVTALNGAGSEAALSGPSAEVAGRAGEGGEGSGRGAGGNAPQTRIARHPRSRTALARARFAFRSDQAGSRFECRLDAARFRPCRSPYVRKVRPGRHAFRVRAVNAAGIPDPTPAVFRWTVS